MKKEILYSVLFVMIIFTSCKDIIVMDISDEKVVLLSPYDHLESYSSTQTFWWEYVEDAEKYQLQVVSPDFVQTETLVLDTLITKDQFLYNLVPGKYQWRVRALNSVYSTDYTIFSLQIDSTQDLTSETIILRTPLQNDTTNKQILTFSWDKLYNADTFNVVLLFEGSPSIDTLTAENSISLSLIDGQGAYVWKVNASNEISRTEYSERQFYLDTSAPLKRTLISPVDQSVIQDSITQCVWNIPSHDGSSEYDSLYIYSDSTITSVVFSAKVIVGQVEVELNPGIYFWGVRGVDKAGNRGVFSDVWSFELSAK
ncbi:MAG: hypothetical protein Q8O72_01800 [Bacteroidales bacterium]|nr:hypothetical protein [Bacteroidales bacterium]